MAPDWYEKYEYLSSGYMLDRPSSRRNPSIESLAYRRLTSGSLSGPVERTGLKRPPTPGGNRQVEVVSVKNVVKDNNYYVRLLNSKLRDIRLEIFKLKNESEECFKNQKFLSIYEVKVRQIAEDLTNGQEQLSDCTLAVDCLTSNKNFNSLENEIEDLIKVNKIQMAATEQIHSDKRTREKEIKYLEHELNSECNYREKVYSNMTSDLQTVYTSLKHHLTTYFHQIEQFQIEIKDLNEKKIILKDIIEKYPEKKQCLLYETKILELCKKLEESKKALRDTELKDTDDNILENLKQDNLHISMMDSKIDELTKKIKYFETMLTIDEERKHSIKNSEEYIKLKKQEEIMEEYFGNEKLQMEMEGNKWKKKGLEVENVLKKLNQKLGQVPNVEDFILIEKYSPENIKSSMNKSNWLRACNKIELMERSVENKRKELAKRVDSMRNEIEEYTTMSELTANIKEKEEQLNNIKNRVISREDEIENKLRNKIINYDILAKKLSENQNNRKIYDMEQHLKCLGEYKYDLKEEIEIKRADERSKLNKNNVLNQIDDINDILIEKWNISAAKMLT